MRVLILDDDPDRHDEFERRFPSPDWVRTHTYDLGEFVRALDEPHDIVHLDHDLGDFAFETELTGQDAARELVKAPWTPSLCVIHSWNPDGAKAMLNILREHGFKVLVKPFSFGDE